MSTELSMNGRKKIATLQNEFNNKFSYLNLTFFDSAGVEISNDRTLSEVRKLKGDDISIVASLKISTLEKKFKEEAGLIVEVSYKKQGVIFFTKEQDSLTLNELNAWCEKNGCDKFDSKVAVIVDSKDSQNPTDDAVLQNHLFEEIKKLFPDAEAKKIGKDNFLDIYIASIYPKRGSHLFFNTSKNTIKVGFYCRDESFVSSVLSNSTNIESYSSGLRIFNNPEFTSATNAIDAAKDFVANIQNSLIEKKGQSQLLTSKKFVAKAEQEVINDEQNEIDESKRNEEVDLLEAINQEKVIETNSNHTENIIIDDEFVEEPNNISVDDSKNEISALLANLNKAVSNQTDYIVSQEPIEELNHTIKEIVAEPIDETAAQPIEKKINTNYKTKFSDFDIKDSATINKLCEKIKQERILPHLPYINNALEKEGYLVDNHVANFFLSNVFISDQNMEGFLYINMDGFYSNCIDATVMQSIFSWSSVKDIRYNENGNNSSIDLIAEEGELTIREEGAHSLKILHCIYVNAWKEANDKFANEPIIIWNVVEDMGINLVSYDTHDAYIN